MAFEALRDYPYGRLAALLEGLTPGRDPVLTHVGDPQGVPPAFVAETITENAALWGRYPPVQGTEAFRQAVADWLNRRYDLPDGMLAPDRHVLSLCGTREGLFQAVLMAVARKRERLPETVRPVVILPNPLYHVYYGAAVMAGAEVVMADATAANGFLPDYHGFPEAVLARTALMFVCSPNNPTGVVTPVRRLECLLELARTHEFILAADECYSEIWFESPPPGLLQCCAAQGGDMSQVLVFNSLSKRSGTPGLRCGFVAGDEGLLQDFFLLRGYGGAQVPGPILAAATALWRDEAHVEETRTRYAGLLAVAAAELDGYPGFRRPDAAFLLWLDAAPAGLTGEELARHLWMEQGVKVMPGRYMARPGPNGTTPGDAYVRVALTQTESVTADICQRIGRTVMEGGV